RSSALPDPYLSAAQPLWHRQAVAGRSCASHQQSLFGSSLNLSVVLTSAFLSVVWLETSLRLRARMRRVPKLTMMFCFVLAVCLLAQLRHPQLLVLFERNAALVSS